MAFDPPIEKRSLAKGRHLDFVERNGWEFVERRNSRGIVVILGVTDHGGLVLVTQWREPLAARVVELPAGLAGDLPGRESEELTMAARREFLEETGFEAASMAPVLTGPPSPGISNEVVTFFRARGLVRRGPGGGEGDERIRTHVVAMSRLDDWLDAMRTKGFQVDPKVLAGAYLARNNH